MKLKHAPRDILRFVRASYRIAQLGRSPISPGALHTLPGKLVVSLTSYPARFKGLDKTLRCLLAQDTAPDAVVLWIAHDDWGLLPGSVRALQDRGLIIRVCEDLRSFKKIIPSLIAYPDAFIAICDDDMLYPRDWLGRLVDGYSTPDIAVCQYARRYTVGADGHPLPFEEWPTVKADERPSSIVQPVGFGGVLYPPHFFPERTLDANQFMSICPNSDDLWLFWSFASAGKRARKVKPIKIMHRPGTQAVALKHTNDDQRERDRQTERMVEAFGLPVQAVRAPEHALRVASR